MNKIKLLLLTVLFASPNLAQSKSCWDDILVATKHSIAAEAPPACVVENAGGAVEELCGSRFSKHSEMFVKFMDYHSQFHSVHEKLRNATSQTQRNALNSQLSGIRRDWDLYGYKFEVDLLLFDVDSAIRKWCRKRRFGTISPVSEPICTYGSHTCLKDRRFSGAQGPKA